MTDASDAAPDTRRALPDVMAEAEPQRGPLRITPRPNGSLFFEGPTEIISADGTVRVSTTRRSLCRCGHSLNKPTCDGAHREAGFEAE